MQTKPPTLAQLAKSLGITVRRVSALKLDGMPTSSIQAAEQWRVERAAAKNTDSAEQLRIEKIKLTRAQRELREAELQRIRGESVLRGEVRQQFTKIGTAVRLLSERIAREVPSAVSGLPLEKALPISRRITRELLESFSNSESEFWQEHPQVSPSTETTPKTSKRKSSKS